MNTNTQGRTPFMPVIPGMGTDGARNEVDAEDTAKTMREFTEGRAAAVIGAGGQVTNTNSPEFHALSQRDQEKMNFLAKEIRSF